MSPAWGEDPGRRCKPPVSATTSGPLTSKLCTVASEGPSIATLPEGAASPPEAWLRLQLHRTMHPTPQDNPHQMRHNYEADHLINLVGRPSEHASKGLFGILHCKQGTSYGL